MTDFLDRFLDDYFAECDEHLANIRSALLTLEHSIGKARPDAAVTEELFRAFHSVKGISAMVEHRETELLAHEMESYLRAVRDGDARLSTEGLEGLIQGAAALEQLIAARRRGEVPPLPASIITTLHTLVPEATAADASEPDSPVHGEMWECRFTPSPDLVSRGISVDVVRARLRAVGDILSATPVITDGGGVAFRFLMLGPFPEASLDEWTADGMICSPHAADPEAAAGLIASPQAAVDRGDAPSRPSGHYVRVDLARLDDLMRIIGELVIGRLRMTDALQRVEPFVPSAEWRSIQDSSGGLERHLRELREGIMRVRLVPVGEIFRRMPFVVRDLARDTLRRVNVELSGQDTEIDKFLVERMMDPILHLVRNAVTHGIESADERLAAGKPPEGTISLSASAAGDVVTIQIADDGSGIDGPRVIERARAAGLPVPPVVDSAALLDLIASPGFSTRDESDRGSGRGFGMAVVKSTVLELGGAIRMESQRGQGTRFSIDLPLTLAITDALIARVGDQTFAIAQTAVREVIEVEETAVSVVQDGEVTPYRGSALPILRLHALLGLRRTPDTRFHAFVIGEGSAALALAVDRILGQREVVVRAIADPLIRVDGMSGATDLGDGRPVLILDTTALARRAHGRRAAPAGLARGIA